MKRIFIAVISLYRNTLSLIMPPSCRFTPTCSEYTQQALSKYGVFKGLTKGLWRLLRCNPWHKGGYDPLT